MVVGVIGFDLDRIYLGPDGSAWAQAMVVRVEPKAELSSMSDNNDMVEEGEGSKALGSSFFSSFLTRT